jgi:hypothetical protein
MSDIPHSYRKYIDDVTKMTQRGHISSGEQQASPSSAGSRGLAKTTQFSKDKTQMQLGQEAIAESMVDIRNIMNRIDGVNVPVKEDAHDDWSKVTNALIKKYGEDKAKAITDYAQIGTDSAEELMKSHGLTHKGDGKDEERWFQKYPWLKQLANKSWMGRLKDIAGEGPDYGTPVKMESAVQEGHYPHIKSFDKLYGINDKQQYKAMADDAQSMDMGEFMDTYSSVIDMAGDFWEDHQKTSESMEGTVNEDPNTLAKELASEIMRWVRRGFDHIPADALKPKAREYLRSVKKPAVNELADDDKIEFTKVMLDISQIKDRVEALSVDEEAKKSAIQSLTNAEEALVALDESAVREDAGEDEKVVDMLRNIKQHLDNHPNMSEHPSLVALDQLADDLESGDKPADYESTSEDSGELGRLKELSGIKEDAGLTDEQKKGLEAIAKKYKDRKGGNGDMLAYGYLDAYVDTGITTDGYDSEEMEAYSKKIGKNSYTDWEGDDHSNFVDQSEITSAMIDDLEKVLGPEFENDAKLSSSAMEYLDSLDNNYEPFPEGDEFDIAEDEDFEEVLGPLGFPEDETELFDAEYQGRKVPLNKPMRGDVKKFKVYVKDPKTGNVKKVNFGHGGTSAKKAGQKTMKIRKSNPKARKSFRARHNCANPGPKTRARYWSCRAW